MHASAKRFSLCLGILSSLAMSGIVKANEPAKGPPTEACTLSTIPQAPRDIGAVIPGKNAKAVATDMAINKMNLCNIHFHRSAEHRSADFLQPSKEGANTGFVCGAKEAANPKKPLLDEHGHVACDAVPDHDTIEVHWVFTSCPAPAKPFLSGLTNCTRCATDKVKPVIRVEAKVFYLSDVDGDDFANYDLATGTGQPKRLPDDTGAVKYVGSTTGPTYDASKVCSPIEATWNVRPTCTKLKRASLKQWCAKNEYGENLAHGVRALVSEPGFLSATVKK